MKDEMLLTAHTASFMITLIRARWFHVPIIAYRTFGAAPFPAYMMFSTSAALTAHAMLDVRWHCE
jgi:hypothetical protein